MQLKFQIINQTTKKINQTLKQPVIQTYNFSIIKQKDASA